MAKEKEYIVTTKKDDLNIREGPGTDYEIVGTVPRGEKVLSPSIAGWVPILLEDDTIGWVSGNYLKEAPEEEPTPEEQEKPEPRFSQIEFPLFQNKLTEAFGTPDYRLFARKNIITIDLGEFSDSLGHVQDSVTGEHFTSFKGHSLLEGPLKKALRLVCKRGLARELKTFDGCFVIRSMRSSRSLSVHSWGLALDFNAETNPSQIPAPSFSDMVRDFSDDFVRCFAKAGFEWGGLWKSLKDPMHFQLPWTQDWLGSSAPLGPKVYFPDGPVEKPELTGPGKFDFSTKEGTIAAIKADCQKQGIGLPEQIAYALATVKLETGGTFMPVREAFYISKNFEIAEEWRRKHLRYYPYYGRGYVQLTWEANYRKYGEIMGIDLINKPDLALEPQNALFILVHGFKTGAFTGKKITDYINSEDTDFYNARKCINGLDRAEKIADSARTFLA
jgi:predicted chitinase